MEFDLESPLTSKPVSTLFLIESQHMPTNSYLQTLNASDFNIRVRREASSSIMQIFRSIFDMSVDQLPRQVLVYPRNAAICSSAYGNLLRLFGCQDEEQRDLILWLSGRRECNIRLTNDREDGECNSGRSQMANASITPLSFLSFFVTLLNLKDHPLTHALKARATDILLNAQQDAKFLEFKPSAVASASLLLASSELIPLQFSGFIQTFSNCQYVNKENIMECCKAMQERRMVFSSVSNSDSQVNVLEQHFSGSESC